MCCAATSSRVRRCTGREHTAFLLDGWGPECPIRLLLCGWGEEMLPRCLIAIVALALPYTAYATNLHPRNAVLLAPVSSACISSPFGPRVLPNRPRAGTYHYGVDLPAPAGAPVRAAAPGQV